jgi:prepilin-type N-terminal cleavage/methylation domain-containing protein
VNNIRHLKDEFGMTLVEVLVSIAIFVIAAVPLLGCFYESVITNADSKIETKEATIAQRVVENIKSGNIKDNKDVQEKITPLYIQEGYYPYIPNGYPKNFTDDVIEYKVEVKKLNSKLAPYTLITVAPVTSITSYLPPPILQP